MSDPQWFEAHGLTIRCDGVSIDAVAASRTSSPDVSFEVAAPGRVPAYGEALSGSPLAHYDDHDGSALSVAERSGREDVVEVCFHGVAHATIDRSTWNVVLRLSPDKDPDLAPVLISGIMLSVVLTLKKYPVLHASAVSVADGRAAVAFIGHSGMGKSTMATLMCRDGAALLTDDVLRTDVVGDTVRAFRGATATRLRAAAESLGREVATAGSRTADGRFSADLPLSLAASAPLRAIVIPQPDRDTRGLTVSRVRGARAVMALARFPRILGWSDPVSTGHALQHWGQLVQRVPVVTAGVPWGPPFAAGIGPELLDALDDLAGA